MGYSAPSLVLFDEVFVPMKKTIIKKCYSQNLQFFVWTPNLFPINLQQKYFLF